MGESYMVICSACQHRFRVTSGPGMRFLVFHCDTCGRDKGVGFDDFGAEFTRLPEGIGPYSLERERDQESPVELRSERARIRQHVEDTAGGCPCGGAFRLDAIARCPDCGSDRYVNDPNAEQILYD